MARYSPRQLKVGFIGRLVHDLVTLPWAVLSLFYTHDIRPEYGMTWPRRYAMAFRMYRNCFRVYAATSYRAHLIMALKLLELPPEEEGVVVECGCFLGGSAVNLSIICDIVGRDLILYDSFEGLPPPTPGDKYAEPQFEGSFRGDLDTVKANIERLGVIERCTFRKGWFSDTLPHHSEPIVACFLDVDYQASLHACVLHLWPHLSSNGYVFMDEYTRLDYGAIFFSEKYWRTYFDTTPPGMLGIGSGVPVGHYFVGPAWTEPPLQAPTSIAYTRKCYHGDWRYFPEEQDPPQ
jgi:O-methyltransferase